MRNGDKVFQILDTRLSSCALSHLECIHKSPTHLIDWVRNFTKFVPCSLDLQAILCWEFNSCSGRHFIVLWKTIAYTLIWTPHLLNPLPSNSLPIISLYHLISARTETKDATRQITPGTCDIAINWVRHSKFLTQAYILTYKYSIYLYALINDATTDRILCTMNSTNTPYVYTSALAFTHRSSKLLGCMHPIF